MSGAEHPISGADNKYLQEKLGTVLVEGLAEICERVPRDPIEYLARWLLHKAKLERMEADEAKRVEELQRLLEEADEERLRQAKRWEEQKRIMEEDARKRRELEAEQRRKQQMMDAMRRRNEKEWRQDIMQYADLTTQEITVAGARNIIAKANPDLATLSDEEIVKECDLNADGIINYEELRTYLKEKFNIPVAPWESGHVPTLQRLTEEDESTDGSRDARGRTELHRWAATNTPNAAEMIEKLINEDNSSLMDRDADGITPRELAQNEGALDNVQNIDRLVLKWIFDGVVNGQTDMLETLILTGFSWFPSASGLAEADLFTPEQIESFGQYLEEIQAQRASFFQAVAENNVAKVEEMLNGNRRLLTARDAKGLGVLHLAVVEKKPEVIKFLRMHFASAMNTRDASGRSAINLAQTIVDEAERDVIVKLLTGQSVTFAEGTPAVQPGAEGADQPTDEQPEPEQEDQ